MTLENIAINVFGLSRWKLLTSDQRKDILEVAKRYAKQFESNLNEGFSLDMSENLGQQSGILSHWKEGEDDSQDIKHFRD